MLSGEASTYSAERLRADPPMSHRNTGLPHPCAGLAQRAVYYITYLVLNVKARFLLLRFLWNAASFRGQELNPRGGHHAACGKIALSRYTKAVLQRLAVRYKDKLATSSGGNCPKAIDGGSCAK